jgi:endo-alpha-1,4-polygalactosaminidase (GH114 family)
MNMLTTQTGFIFTNGEKYSHHPADHERNMENIRQMNQNVREANERLDVILAEGEKILQHNREVRAHERARRG